MKKIYLDHAASTPVDPRVLRAMRPYFSSEFGNPGSLHSLGQKAIAAVDASREEIGKLIGAKHFREVIFTSGATEANNLALRGVVDAYKKNHAIAAGADTRSVAPPRIIVSSIEHESILETAHALAQYGTEVICLPTDNDGIVDLETLRGALTESTVLVSIMCVNNEIGAIQPLAEIKNIIEEFKSRTKSAQYPLFHTDAAQAFTFLDCDVRKLGVDMMTLSAHKMYGPKGIGALYVRTGISLAPQITGGGQEFGVRSGTENVPGIVGFAKAVELAAAAREKELKRTAALRGELWKTIKKIFPAAEVNGADDSAPDSAARIAPHILNIYFPGHDAQDMLTRFDRAGLAASSGSACHSRAVESSYVIEALGYGKARAGSSIRFSLGRGTTKREIAASAKIIEKVLG